MTQPIQEPSTDRSVSGLDWGVSQLARRPAIIPNGGPAWVALTDDGCNESVGNEVVPVVFDIGYVSDNATGIFELTTTTEDTFCGSDTTVYHAFLKTSGVYTFALQVQGQTDQVGPAEWTMDTSILPLTTVASGAYAYYPGQFQPPAQGLEHREHFHIPDTGDYEDNIWYVDSRTIPILRPASPTSDEITVTYNFNPAFPDGQSYSFQLWVTYHGPINWTGGPFEGV